jgi:hypothetical protein
MAMVSKASRHLDAHHELLHSLGSLIGEQCHDAAEIACHPAGAGDGPQLSDAAESATPALAMSLAAREPSPEQIKDGLCTIRESYAHATEAIHALVAAFVRDRF